MEGERENEGHVTFADDSVLSLQCFEDRHGECPQLDVVAGTENDFHSGPFDGYHCECACHGSVEHSIATGRSQAPHLL